MSLFDLYSDQTPIRLTKVTIVIAEGARYQERYWLEGVLANPIVIAHPIEVDRARRSRREGDSADAPQVMEVSGLFTSSYVQRVVEDVDGWLIHTVNSVWRLSLLTPASNPV